MKARVLLFLILMLLLFYNEAAETNPLPEEKTQNGTVLLNDDSTGHLINNLTIADVRNILEILLLILKRNPDLPTLKLLGQFIHSIAQHNEENKEAQQDFFVGPDVDGELQQLLQLISFGGISAKPQRAHAAYGPPTTKVEDCLVKASDAVTPTGVIEHDATLSPGSTLDEKTRHVQKNFLADYDATSTDTTAGPSQISSTQTNSPNQRSGGLYKHSPTEDRNASSFEVNEDISRHTHNLNGNFTINPKTIEFETFPLLTDMLIKTLKMNNFRYVRTYSEVLEPVNDSSGVLEGVQNENLEVDPDGEVIRNKRSVLKRILNIS